MNQDPFPLSASISDINNYLLPLSPNFPFEYPPIDIDQQQNQFLQPECIHSSSHENSPNHNMFDSTNIVSISPTSASISIPFESRDKIKSNMKTKKKLNGNTRATLSRDILLNISSQDFDAFVDTLQNSSPLTSVERQEISIQRRMIKNREYASSKRREKKTCEKELQSKIDELISENNHLKSENQQLRAENEYLKQIHGNNQNDNSDIFQFEQYTEISPKSEYDDIIENDSNISTCNSSSDSDDWIFPRAPSFLTLDSAKSNTTMKTVTTASYFLVFFLCFGLLIGYMSPYQHQDQQMSMNDSRYSTGRLLLVREVIPAWEKPPVDIFQQMARYFSRFYGWASTNAITKAPKKLQKPTRVYTNNARVSKKLNVATVENMNITAVENIQSILFTVCPVVRR